MDYIHEIGKRAKSVSAQVQHLSQNQKNEGLRRVAEELENQKSYLMAENEKDIEKAKKNIKNLNPNAKIICVSAKSGEGMDEFVGWLKETINN